MHAKDPPRAYDLVVWGATGYTGRLVALAASEHLVGHRWAIAGRSRERLEAIQDEIVEAGGHSPEIVIATLDDPASMQAMTGSSRVVLSTVGPYDLVGETLIEACIATSTHVCDITGEVPWVRRMRSRHESAAREAGIRVVSMCGYDSIPSELGVRLAQEAAAKHHGRPAREVEMAVGPIRGGVSGGTIASALNMIAKAKDPEVRRGLRGPAALCVATPPECEIATGEQWGIRRSPLLGIWTAPFFMAGVNVAVVHRTHELLGRPWGDDFRYRECAAGGRGPLGLLRATGLTLFTIGLVIVLLVPPLRWIARRWLLPSPGEGPDDSKLDAGFMRHRTASVDPPVMVDISVDMDPGYAATARMLLACGRSLIEEDTDPAILDAFCTPGALFGSRLVPRLEAMGFGFHVQEHETGLDHVPPTASIPELDVSRANASDAELQVGEATIPCACGYDRRTLHHLAACPECGGRERKPAHHVLFRWARSVGRTAMLLAVVDCLFAAALVVYYANSNDDEVLILLPIQLWFLLILPASVLGFVLSCAAMAKADGCKDTEQATIRLVISSILAAIVPPIVFFILAVLWISAI